MKTKTYALFGEEQNSHIFDIVITALPESQRKFELKASSNQPWSSHIQGEVLLSITDTNDGLTLSKNLGSALDYADSNYLTILLKFIHFFEDKKYNYQVFEQFHITTL